MTTQVSERVLYKGRTAPLAATPLESLLRAHGKKSPFDDADSDLWRGHIGTWQVDDGRLYLFAVIGQFRDGSDGTLSTVFPDSSDRVFARWFSGTLPIGEGRVLFDDLVCFAVHEREILICRERDRGRFKLGTAFRRTGRMRRWNWFDVAPEAGQF